MSRRNESRSAFLTLLALSALALTVFLAVAFARFSMRIITRERSALHDECAALFMDDARAWTEHAGTSAAVDEWTALPVDERSFDSGCALLEVCHTADNPNLWHARLEVATESGTRVREAHWRTTVK